MSGQEPGAPPVRRGRSLALRATLLALFLLAGVVLWHSFDANRPSAEALFDLVRSHPALAPLIFVAGFTLAVVFQLPTLPLNLGAGALWGVWWGSMYSLVGGVLGSMATFLFARTVFGRPLAERAMGGLMSRASANIGRSGWRIVAVMRLNPALPCGPVNFVLAFSGLPLSTFVWATALFNAPPCVAVSYLGHSAGRVLLEGGLAPSVQLAFAAIGVVLLLAAGRMLFRAQQPAPPPGVLSTVARRSGHGQAPG